MISKFKKTKIKWAVSALALTLVVGCSNTPVGSGQKQNSTTINSQQKDTSTNVQQNSVSNNDADPNTNPSPSPAAAPSKSNPISVAQATQSQPSAAQSILSDIMKLGKQGKVINSDFADKTNTIEDVQKVWGTADQTSWIAAASGNFATYSSHNVVFGINKGEQIFEIRSYDSRLKMVTLQAAESVLGTPAYDAKINGQEVIGYTAGSEFKVELVFPQPTEKNPNPVLDHYNVLYPQGTVNYMADYPGRQW